MEFSKEKVSHFKRKVIPWHVQKRYNESLSQLSLNQSIATAFYKKEIKSLKLNNKHLALALQRSRYLTTEKENLLIDNGKILDIINFSKLKLMDMDIHMKQANACLNETLSLLNSAITPSVAKHFPNVNYRSDFKNKLQESKIEPIKEVLESPIENSKKNGKISRIDGCIAPPNKKCKLGEKVERIKKNCNDVSKFAVKSSEIVPNIISKDICTKNSKKCGSALNIKSQRKKSLLNSSKSSIQILTTNSNISLQTKSKQKCKPVKVMLTDIAEMVPTLVAENGHSPATNEPTSSANNTNSDCLTQNSDTNDILTKKIIFSEILSKQKNSAVNSCTLPFTSINDAEVSDSHDSSRSFLQEKLTSETTGKPLSLPLEKIENLVCSKANSVKEKNQIKNSDDYRLNRRKSVESNNPERDKKLYKPHSSILSKRLPYYYDEDAIERVDEEGTASKNRARKSMNKCKARKTVSNMKKNTILKSNCKLPDAVSKLGKNSFLVTAEIHSPPNGIYPKETKNKIYVAENMEPCVVLTDIFKSNRSLLSEMVGTGLQENRCLQKTITNSNEVPLSTSDVNSLNVAYMDCENNAEK